MRLLEGALIIWGMQPIQSPPPIACNTSGDAVYCTDGLVGLIVDDLLYDNSGRVRNWNGKEFAETTITRDMFYSWDGSKEIIFSDGMELIIIGKSMFFNNGIGYTVIRNRKLKIISMTCEMAK